VETFENIQKHSNFSLQPAQMTDLAPLKRRGGLPEAKNQSKI